MIRFVNCDADRDAKSAEGLAGNGKDHDYPAQNTGAVSLVVCLVSGD